MTHHLPRTSHMMLVIMALALFVAGVTAMPWTAPTDVNGVVLGSTTASKQCLPSEGMTRARCLWLNGFWKIPNSQGGECETWWPLDANGNPKRPIYAAMWTGKGCATPCYLKALARNISPYAYCAKVHQPENYNDGGCKLVDILLDTSGNGGPQCNMMCRRLCTQASISCRWDGINCVAYDLNGGR